SGERQLFIYREDANPFPLFRLRIRIGRKDESCFGKIHLARERLHFLIAQAPSVGENGERITGQRFSRENIKLHEFRFARHVAISLRRLNNASPTMETPLTPLEFARRARKLYPERVAVIDGDSSWTYSQFFDRCDRWSVALQAFGIARGDRVAYLSPNTHSQL